MVQLHLELLAWIWTVEVTHPGTEGQAAQQIQAYCGSNTHPSWAEAGSRTLERDVFSHPWKTPFLFALSHEWPSDNRTSCPSVSQIQLLLHGERGRWEQREEPKVSPSPSRRGPETPASLQIGHSRALSDFPWHILCIHLPSCLCPGCPLFPDCPFLISTWQGHTQTLPLPEVFPDLSILLRLYSITSSGHPWSHPLPACVLKTRDVPLCPLPILNPAPWAAVSTKGSPCNSSAYPSLAQGLCSWRLIGFAQRISCLGAQGQVLWCVTLGQTCPSPADESKVFCRHSNSHDGTLEHMTLKLSLWTSMWRPVSQRPT